MNTHSHPQGSQSFYGKYDARLEIPWGLKWRHRFTADFLWEGNYGYSLFYLELISILYYKGTRCIFLYCAHNRFQGTPKFLHHLNTNKKDSTCPAKQVNILPFYLTLEEFLPLIKFYIVVLIPHRWIFVFLTPVCFILR